MADKNKLKGLREEIDRLDLDILSLLNKRAEISLSVGKQKAGSSDQVFKPFREKEVLGNLVSHNPGPLPEKHLRTIYREILSSSRRLQRPERVVYLGPEGTFSYFAAIEHLGQSANLDPKNSFEEIFRAVADGDAELGIIPLENSIQGTVGQNVDLFMQYPVYIQAEVYSRISHALMGKMDSIEQVNKIYSHPKALEQCTAWLNSNLPGCPQNSMSSTASAAELVAETNIGGAVVGNVKLARIFGLNVLREHLEDLPDNWTRFLVIGPHQSTEGNRDKTSILFTTPDKPGALATVLNTLAGSGINMTKLESRPFRGEKWKYVFFTDLECDLNKAEYENLLNMLRENCHTLRILGSYPSGSRDSGEKNR